MISKKLIASLLGISALGTLSAGCVVTPGPSGTNLVPLQSLTLEASLADEYGNPMSIYFDYYLDMTTTDGTYLGLYHQDQTTDINGNWSWADLNPTFYASNGVDTCYNSCLEYSYDTGCTLYAQDCYNNAYTATIDMNYIAVGSVAATVGVDYINPLTQEGRYLSFASSQNFSDISYSPYGSSDFVQDDLFTIYSTIPSYNQATARTANRAAATTLSTSSTVVSARTAVRGQKFSVNTNTVYKHSAKPTVVTDLTQLSFKQKAKVALMRKALVGKDGSSLPSKAFSKSLF